MKWLETPSYSDLVTEAEKLNITYAGRGVWDLFIDICGNSTHSMFKGLEKYDRKYTDQERNEILKRNETILRPTVFPTDMRSQVLDEIGKKPHAFSGYVFGNSEETVQFTWSKSVKCFCGTKFQMERQWKEQNKFDRKENVDLKLCPQCKKKWLWITFKSSQ